MHYVLYAVLHFCAKGTENRFTELDTARPVVIDVLVYLFRTGVLEHAARICSASGDSKISEA